jgi:hypothetical protein
MTTKPWGEAIMLLVTAVVASAIAWAFWHFFGSGAFDALTMLAIVGLVLENIRLRRKLKMSREG